MKEPTRRYRLPAILLAAVLLLAWLSWWRGYASWLEAVAFATGAACVWLTVIENVWNFPIGLVNVAAFAFVFFRARLFADAGLQVVYFVLGIHGWYLWLRGGVGRTRLQIERASRFELATVGAAVAGSTFLLWAVLSRVGGSASAWDALTTSISLGAQWLLNRKKLENWLLWILVDVIYIPLYLYKDLQLTALLYAVFLVLACLGWRSWRAAWRAGRGAA